MKTSLSAEQQAELDVIQPQLDAVARLDAGAGDEGICAADLPVDVSADAIVYAVHAILKDGRRQKARPDLDHRLRTFPPKFGTARDVDFSQLEPRGHSTDDASLGRYFRAMT